MAVAMQALVVVDMQNDFVLPGSPVTVAGVGFERREVAEFVTAARADQGRMDMEGPAGRAVVRPKAMPEPVRDKVSWDGKLDTVTISTPLTEDETQILKAAVTTETAAAAIDETARISRTTAIEFFHTPAELGERFRVPQLEVLAYPWDLSPFDATLTGDDPSALGKL